MANRFKQELNKPIVKYGLGAVGVLFLFQVVILPWLDWRHETTDFLKLEAQSLVNKETLETAISNISDEQASIIQDLSQVESLFANFQENPRVELPTTVRQQAESFDLFINGIAVVDIENENQSIQSFMVNITGEGSVDNIMKFINLLESDSFFYVVDRLTVYDGKRTAAKFRMELVKHVKA